MAHACPQCLLEERDGEIAEVAKLSLVIRRLVSTYCGPEEGDPLPYASMTTAIYAAVNAVDRAEGREPTYPEE